MVDNTILDIIEKIMSIWSLLLILCGFIFNLLVFVICVKSKKLRSTSTFKILAIGAINDMLMCFPWNFDDFADYFFDLQVYSRSLFYCEFIKNFLQYVTITSWLLVSISFDRVLALHIKTWSTHYFNGLKPVYFCSLILAIIVSVNFVAIFKTGYSYRNENGTEIVVCFVQSNSSTEIYDVMGEVKFL